LEPDLLLPQLDAQTASFFSGIHWEEDFVFIFFAGEPDLSSFLKLTPALELRQIHRLRYDQWQDGAYSSPIRLGALEIIPIFRGGPDCGTGPAPNSNPQPSLNQTGNLDRPPSHTGPKVGSGHLPPLAPLTIDPGLAFGFGGHPTTKACLEFLLAIFAPGVIKPKNSPATVLDLGCGTGVLALAAARLGAGKVLGVDHSHLAVDSAKKNTRANNLSDRVTIERGLAQDYASYPAELVTANIPMFVIDDLIEARAFSGRSYLIISGLLLEEGELFLKKLAKTQHFNLSDSCRSDRWISYLLEL
jgi:ribosomal protein L11 methyltransferase